MSIWDITSIGLEKALRATEVRQAVLTNNIANVSTPGFKRSDVSFNAQLQQALDAGDEAAAAELEPAVRVDSSGIYSADGNNVSLDTEMAALAENQIRHSMLTSMLRDRVDSIRYAIREGR